MSPGNFRCSYFSIIANQSVAAIMKLLTKLSKDQNSIVDARDQRNRKIRLTEYSKVICLHWSFCLSMGGSDMQYKNLAGQSNKFLDGLVLKIYWFTFGFEWTNLFPHLLIYFWMNTLIFRSVHLLLDLNC